MDFIFIAHATHKDFLYLYSQKVKQLSKTYGTLIEVG